MVRGDDNLLGKSHYFFFRRQRELVSRSFKEIEKKDYDNTSQKRLV